MSKGSTKRNVTIMFMDGSTKMCEMTDLQIAICAEGEFRWIDAELGNRTAYINPDNVLYITHEKD